MSDFKINLSIFNDEKNAKIDYSGTASIKQDDIPFLIDYLQNATPDQYGSVSLRLAGWKKKSKKGTAYISAVVQPPRQQQQSAQEDMPF